MRIGQFGVTTLWYSWALADGDAWPQYPRACTPSYYVPIGTDVQTKGGAGWPPAHQ